MRTVDFTADPDGVRRTINDWVAQQTADKIKDLIPSEAINPLTRMVLANAIYFNASWFHPFEKSLTTDEDFILPDQNVIQVPMMHETESMGYMQGDGYQAVDLAYVGGDLSVLIIVPDQDQFGVVETGLSTDFINTVIASLQYGRVNLGLPKFKFESSFSLSEALTGMGMTDAFDLNSADFSGMDGARDLYISAVIHKAYVAVDEAGTEAAAATAVIMAIFAMPAEPITLTIDRPFIFAIRDIPTGSILFMGRVMKPLGI